MIASLNNRQYRFIRLAALLFTCLLLGNVSLRAQATQSPVPQPDPPTPVVDTADVIDAATEQRLNNILKNLSENPAANAEFGVVTVRTTAGQDIFDYSLAIMRGWGVGLGEKGGLLLVVAVDDHKYFTQVSRHLEGDLPDGLVGQIQRERLVPQFKQNNYSKGISDTIEAYVATLAQKRSFNVEGIDQRRAYGGNAGQSGATDRRTSSRGLSKNMIVIIIIIVVFLFLSSRGGGSRGGCGGGGCLNMLLLNSLLNSGRGGWGSSGWGGGGFGGGSGWGGGGGGGSDWGGFSGGGGDAGGGGAGGSW